MTKYSLAIDQPIMNAAGSLGFTPARRGPVDQSQIGAFVTNPISLGKRTPANGTRMLPFEGGFLLHTGYPNPGMRAVIRRYASSWAQQALPVWVHLLAEGEGDISQMVRMLEGREGVAGVEVGLASNADLNTALAYTLASLGELPVIVRLPLDRSLELAETVMSAGANAVSLGPPRGAILDPNGKLVFGRLYGPGLLPIALYVVKRLASTDIPVVAAGGVYRPQDVQAMLLAGALAVQLDAVLWRGY